MDKFWLVWREQGGAPKFKHHSHEAACCEAERLARANPGQRFYVMERVSSCIKADVVWDGELVIPF